MKVDEVGAVGEMGEVYQKAEFRMWHTLREGQSPMEAKRLLREHFSI